MSEKPLPKSHFASDNTAGICPEAWEATARANEGHLASYGDDAWTQRASDLIRETFETDCEVFFVFNGTSANSLALAACCQSYHSVICHEQAHIQQDECGAPEFFSNGTKLLTAPGAGAKITAENLAYLASKRKDIHFPKPRVVSLTQSSELGTVYRKEELAAIDETARRFDLITHMDGARFANAVASLGVSAKEITWQAGVDVLCFGGTKLGMANCEAVVFFDRELAADFAYRCKQAGQLASKMRFLAAGWVGMLEHGAWLKHAAHANRHAKLLAARLEKETGLQPAHPVEANAIFIMMPPALVEGMRARGWVFYNFYDTGLVRLMCSWRTSEADIELFVADARALMAKK
jgi:threonine aldolase